MSVMERLDLTEYMRNRDKPNGVNGKGEPDEYGWTAGSQLDAFRFYTDPEKIEILATHQDDDYQGQIHGIAKVEERFFLWRDSFGSCSGCDALDGSNGYDYIKDTLQEGNTRQFLTLDDAEEYIKTKHEDYMWDDFPIKLFNEARKRVES